MVKQKAQIHIQKETEGGGGAVGLRVVREAHSIYSKIRFVLGILCVAFHKVRLI